MTEITFKNQEEVYNWIFDNMVQNDPRYIPLAEEIMFPIYFIYDKGISIEEKSLPNIEEPSKEQLTKITGPQKYHKFIALKLLELEGIKKEETKIEFTFHGRRADVYAVKNDKEILVECCSCYVLKIIQYLENLNTELWIITSAEDTQAIKLFVLKRGKNWDECYGIYKRYKEEEFKRGREAYDKAINEMLNKRS